MTQPLLLGSNSRNLLGIRLVTLLLRVAAVVELTMRVVAAALAVYWHHLLLYLLVLHTQLLLVLAAQAEFSLLLEQAGQVHQR